MFLLVLAALLLRVERIEEREPGVEFVTAEAVADIDIRGGPVAEVLVEAAREVGPGDGIPLALGDGCEAG